MKRVRKAVLPVGGLGTRILPAAKTTPKNMLNVFDRPILAHVVAEGRAAGIEHFVFVTGRGQDAIAGFDGDLRAMTGMVEKPAPGTEPSNLFISGRYVLQPEIFDLLAEHRAGAGGEIQLTDAMVKLMAGQPFHALQYRGVTYDCGDAIGLLRANIAFALKHPTLGEAP